MRTTTLAGILLAIFAVASCSNSAPAPAATTTAPASTTSAATTPALTGDAATIAAVKEAAPRLRAANGIIQGCLVEVTPACDAAATDEAAPAANSLAVALGSAPGESAEVMADVPLLMASLSLLGEDVGKYQADGSAVNWKQIVFAADGVVALLDASWVVRGA